jgi:hypothetical protein
MVGSRRIYRNLPISFNCICSRAEVAGQFTRILKAFLRVSLVRTNKYESKKKIFRKNITLPTDLNVLGTATNQRQKTYCFQDGTKPKATEHGRPVRKSVHFLVSVKPGVSV